jgi:hypothetical protein
MFKASITLAALIAAVSIASAPVLARGGGSAGGGGHTSPPANKTPAVKNIAKGTHFDKVILHVRKAGGEHRE